MKRFSLIILSVLLIFCFCSCTRDPHRSIVFDDGTVICFNGSCAIYDTYIRYDLSTSIVADSCYVSIGDRSFEIVSCDCDYREDV